jgi:hypothetical protein
MESIGHTRHQDLSRRPALTISRIVSRSLYDIPVGNVVIMKPAARRPDSTQSFAAAVQSFTTDLSRQQPKKE